MTPITVGGITVAPGTEQRIELPIARLPTQTMLSLPVHAINGHSDGPHLWLSAAIHGDELNGVEIIRQVLEQVKPNKLQGALLAVPIVNIFGFIEQSRYLPDRRDLNRSFPGSAKGSLAGRIAHLFMKEIVSHCSHGIDLHTASNHRVNLPQIRANLDDSETYRCAQAFGAPAIIHANTRDGSLRQAAAKQGISVLLYESGEALRFDQEAIKVGVEGVLQVMTALKMMDSDFKSDQGKTPPKESRETKWVRASQSGILHLQIELGQTVNKRQKIGYIADALGDTNKRVQSPCDGIVIGFTKNPLVNQGDGIVHVAML
ncbi:succinylglutamate desuccinylase/aspartoacylase family protein (plasmid) [Acaryochloris sp. 'Moss Beach']|uniref:succinylglutamate desuccinylase/aspartoacylase family protein n=1 Tax=Acaryochloris TaxID=155977 RepID=UPI001BAECDBC|nr:MULTISPECIES: succinylglutamate desuccinylase/aspartoacylase family protein [Acaryochloris]QUY40327.1 succinylglutamate desuccinylase/aspartoacylase family protein [Acaryochloris marina S15]UJB72255.1 succinylglutamate desuccinylase/aspartoacylase family protein [Acaryochloris sp. 'Moss Beach']